MARRFGFSEPPGNLGIGVVSAEGRFQLFGG
jgi:hypothetical protein